MSLEEVQDMLRIFGVPPAALRGKVGHTDRAFGADGERVIGGKRLRGSYSKSFSRIHRAARKETLRTNATN